MAAELPVAGEASAEDPSATEDVAGADVDRAFPAVVFLGSGAGRAAMHEV